MRNDWKFFGVLPRADRALAVAWWVVLVLRGLLPAVFAIAIGMLVGAVQRGETSGRPRWRWWACVRALAGAAAGPSGHRAPISAAGRRPGSTTGSTAACVRPAGDGAPRGPGAHQRPHHGARLRPRHHRPAAVHLDGLHRLGAGRDDRRPGLGRRARRLCVVGAAPAGRRLAGHALAAARERRVAGPEHRGGPQRPAPCRVRLPAGGRAAGRQGAAALRAGGLGRRPLPRRAGGSSSSSTGRRPACASGPWLWSLLLVLAANVVVFWSLASAAADGALALGSAGDLRDGRHQHQHDRLRRLVVGARRRRRAGGGGAPSRGGDGPAGALSRGTGPAAGMPAREIRFRDVTFAYPAAAARCSTAST